MPDESRELVEGKRPRLNPVPQGVSGASKSEKPPLNSKGLTEGELITLTEAYSPMSEQYRLLFSKVDRICQAEGKVVIAMTSSVKGEGKTTTLSNLAVVGARDFNKRILLIDADFKNPSIGKTFGLKQGFGLADFMMKRCTLESVLTTGRVNNLTIVPVGQVFGREEMTPTIDGLRDILSKVRGQYPLGRIARGLSSNGKARYWAV